MEFISALRERGVPVEIEFDYRWLHVQGRYIVFDDKVADPTASFSSVEHLCVGMGIVKVLTVLLLLSILLIDPVL